MKFEEARKALKDHKRIWHKEWKEMGFIMKDPFHSKVYHLTLWNELVEALSKHISQPSFKGKTEDRLYSTIMCFYISRNETNEGILNTVKKLIIEYLHPAEFTLAMMGFKVVNRITTDDWEVI